MRVSIGWTLWVIGGAIMATAIVELSRLLLAFFRTTKREHGK